MVWNDLYEQDAPAREKILKKVDDFLSGLRSRRYFILEFGRNAPPSGDPEAFPLTAKMSFYMDKCALLPADALVLAIAAAHQFWTIVTLDHHFMRATKMGFAVLRPTD